MPRTKTPKRRGAVHKVDCSPVTIWVPKDWADLLDRAVSAGDTDRSKFIRLALREKLTAMKILKPAS
jgi:metal-responsive CopG/Arc/MetJ family transcriptional regulator